jgi:branched-chain amino acid transport system substrate-binding protein
MRAFIFGTTCAVFLAACGEPPTGVGQVPAIQPERPLAPIDPKLGELFSGGTAGKTATLEPITVGWLAQEGGSPSEPEATVSFKAAVAYINSALGGIHGHPLLISQCTVVNSDAQGQICAQQFLNDASLKVIVQVGLNHGNATFHSTINGQRPVLMSFANPGPDTEARNAYGLTSASISYISTVVPYLRSLHAHTVALISPEGAIDVEVARAVQAGLEASGVRTILALFPENGTDLVTPLVASGALSADAVLPLVVRPASCIALGKATRQIGLKTPVVATGLCATDAVKSALGDFPRFTYHYSLLNPNAPDDTGQVDFYRAVMAKHAPPHAELGLGAPYAFTAGFALAKVLNSLTLSEAASTEAIGKALSAFAGPLLLGPPQLKYGSLSHFPALMTADGRWYTYEGDGHWTKSSGWISVE